MLDDVETDRDLSPDTEEVASIDDVFDGSGDLDSEEDTVEVVLGFTDTVYEGEPESVLLPSADLDTLWVVCKEALALLALGDTDTEGDFDGIGE